MSDRISAITTLIAAIISGVIALGTPLVYFATAYQNEKAVVSTAAEITTRMVSNFAAQYPGLWPFMEYRIEEVLYRSGGDVPEGVSKQILDKDNNVVLDIPHEAPFPAITLEKRFWISGQPVGAVVLKRSYRGLLKKTAVAVLVGLLAGLMSFLALRRLPISALNKALADLYEEKEKTSAILKGIGDAVITIDKDLCVLTANMRAEIVLGAAQEVLAGKSMESLFSADAFEHAELLPSFFRRVTAQGEILVFPNDIIRKQGGREFFSLSGAPIRDKRGVITGGVFVIRDVTQHHQFQEEQLKLQQMESLGVLAGGIAHDFNNLLSLILGNAELVAVDMAPDDPNKKMLLNACESIEHARSLTGRLLTFSSGGAPLQEEINISQLIKQRADSLLAGSNIRVHYNMLPSIFPVSADVVQIGQVVQNIVLNAKEAMPDGGDLKISAENVILEENNLLTLPPGAYVRISFSDTGPGISLENRSRIFEPYFSTKTRGTQKGMGLGLATCLSIIKKHGGALSVESNPEKGAVFHVILPAI
ncbi:signal transduction histidine kinase, nitrogen specific, NtrB [Desulfatibacillum aliphaticivorans]|uniref:histidine kinase n=1 Tax=Desulfatibacillum aliphaticivorans TaxID=218208 RepID=B8FB92_DESAL|nr:ATP-binding protein [Desulfatibacillum aliphaticivorans]ACL04536.1 signal transduction histidine kinase, nitrogen specific, NtrB [Desulfatibacillum aliphaticivorans]